MYDFTDTNQSFGGPLLPSEALKINGEYIENQINGYRTLNVSGRESLSPELSYFETGVRDGSVLNSKRYPARTIVVTYQLIADTNEAFREAYNKLGQILNVENAELIFNDEPDKFFIGTPMTIGEVEPGKNAVTGEIEIFCADPFKYSVIEYEADCALDENSILLDYNGTYKSFPILETDFYSEKDVADDGETAGTLTGNGDCGYVAFFTEDENIIQLGDPDEVDGTEAFARSQTLMNQTFQSNTAWGTTAKALWSVNAGTIPAEVEQVGSVGMKIASYAVPANPASTSGTLLNRAASTASSPTIYYTVTAKTSGRTASSVKVNVAITTSLRSTASYFGRGLGLKGSIYMGGAWHDVTLKNTSEYWRGNSGHTANISFTVSGLSNTTSSITGIRFKVNRTDTSGQAGILSERACSNLAVSQYVASVPETYYLAATSYGTASGKYHGPSITRTIGADAAGEVGASDFTLTYNQKLCVNSVSQLGGFHARLTAADGMVVAGVRIVKNQAGNSASLMLFVNNSKVHQVGIDLSYNNKYFGASSSAVKTSTITKNGGTVRFNIGGYSMTFSDSTIANVKVTKCTFMFEQYSTYAALAYNGLHWAKFVKNNCETFNDIPNKFSANDVLEADCKNGEIRLNGVLTPSLGALGNDWEGFFLTPGLNQIGISYSNWVEDAYRPTFKVRYREVFL